MPLRNTNLSSDGIKGLIYSEIDSTLLGSFAAGLERFFKAFASCQ
jgi:hypothetical protein